MNDPGRDLIGWTFGRLGIIGASSERRGSRTLIVCDCICSCGTQVRTPATRLRQGNTRSCGCIHGLDLTGRRFGRLTVLGREGTERTGGGRTHRKWRCACDCGTAHKARSRDLLAGGVRSCGCLRRDLGAQRAERMRQATQSSGSTIRREAAIADVFGEAPAHDPALEPPKRWTDAPDAAMDLARAMGYA